MRARERSGGEQSQVQESERECVSRAKAQSTPWRWEGMRVWNRSGKTRGSVSKIKETEQAK